MKYIDLGLPSGKLWADCNVGTEDCRESGDYFTYDKALKLQTKEEILPSKKDFQELIDHCKWEWKELTHCKGYQITGPNSASIFFPAAGDCYESSHYYVNQLGKYWSSTRLENNDYGVYHLYFCCNYYNVYWAFYDNLLTVRLIKKKNKNMEKRKIEIDIITAREWYNSNNESLKTIALQAFKEKELKNYLPKTWEEWKENNKATYYVPSCLENKLVNGKDVEAHIALIQLHVLRDAYRDSYEKGWKPDVNNINQVKCNIAFTNNGFEIYDTYTITRFLSFPTEELAEEFLKNFKGLIEQAKDFI